MSDQLILAWTVDVSGSSFGPIEAATALAAIPLYVDANTDPVLGQYFGLTVENDATTNDATSATRTLTLNMTSANRPEAPPPFPCHPITSTPPTLPYPLRARKALPGSFFVQTGSAIVATSATQLPSLVDDDELVTIQFLSQVGVPYEAEVVASATQIEIDPPFTGTSGETGAFKEFAAPCPLNRAAAYSSSELDTAGVATIPPIPAGAGARTVELTYNDSAGNGPFTATATLTGKRPALFNFDESGGLDIAEIVNLVVTSTGGFNNSIGEITVVELSDALPVLPPNLPLGTGVGAAETTRGKVGAVPPRTFKTMTDDAQLLILRHLAYLPPSFFALAQQQISAPQLEGDFIVTTKSVEVFTTVDQTGVLSEGDFIEFAIQPGTLYQIAELTDRILTLTSEFLGIDTNNTGLLNTPMNNSAQTKGNIGTIINSQPTGARSPAIVGTPSDDQLSGPLGGFVATETAGPPPNPPLSPATVPAPTFLSDLFTRTIQLALAGVPITAQPITFA